MRKLANLPIPDLGWGVTASVSVHAVFMALLIFGLPQLTHETEEVAIVEVEIVQSPDLLEEEEEPPQPEPPEEEPPEELVEPEEPEEQSEELVEEETQEESREQPSEAERETAQEEAAGQPPEETGAETAEDVADPPQGAETAEQEPPEAAEQPETGSPRELAASLPPEEESAAQDPFPPPPQVENDESSTEAEEQSTPPSRVLRPVFEFGEEDSGPRETDAGDDSSETVAEPGTPPDEPPPDLLFLEPDPLEDGQRTEAPPGVLGSLTPLSGDDQFAALVPDPNAVAVPIARPPIPADETRQLNSTQNTGSRTATTAIRSLPRGVRAGELCATALRQQLRRSLPPYFPDLLPAYRLDQGTILQVRRGAFRSAGQWFDLKFRCEVDPDATRVVSFDFDVGNAIPRSEWRSRGFPAN